MRILLIVGWLFAGLGGAIYHFGPGQNNLEIDRIADLLDEAHQSVRDENWKQAVQQFDQVLADLPDDRRFEMRQIELEKCKAQMMAAELPTAREALAELLADARNDPNADPRFVADVQSTLANSQYYMTWLMRLEGMPEADWMPEIEAARQHYTQLSIDARACGDTAMAAEACEDLESAIRLARMDLGELQGLPLPSQ
jgi:hypothetical protein